MSNEKWDSYFEALCDVISDARMPDPRKYKNVLWHMHNTEFVPVLEFDMNRVQDALDYRAKYIDDTYDPVGIFELMVSLADRIESDIMGGTADHDRTAEWFWGMFISLGLKNMTDDVYDERVVDLILRKFVLRAYYPSGRGGLFTVNDSSVDMTDEEIWYQAALFLNDILREEGVLDP